MGTTQGADFENQDRRECWIIYNYGLKDEERASIPRCWEMEAYDEQFIVNEKQ